MPPVKQANLRLKAGIAAVTADKVQMEEIAANAEKSTWFDASSVETRKARERVRANFEQCINDAYDLHTDEEIWAPETFIKFTKEFLEIMLIVIPGKIGTKLRASTLYSYKNALCWWAVRYIEGFARISVNWHKLVTAHIHFLGHEHSMEQGTRPKNNLTDTELMLFYHQLFQFHQGMENWKQNYLAWVLVYTTGVRPGSFTVAKGYEKGADLGVNGLIRQEDETLRWKDVSFFRFPGTEGIAVRITFKYIKGHRDPFSNSSGDGRKMFTFLPTRGERYELDVSAIILGIAFSRGLFPFATLEELLSDDQYYVPTLDEIAEQAVFVAADQANSIVPTQAMLSVALGVKLKQMCVAVGLLEHNTMYSFRRTAIIDTRRKLGTEVAREVAGHAPGSFTYAVYDTEQTADLDIAAMRTGDAPVISREAIRDAFKQANVSRADPQTVDLPKELTQRTRAAMIADPQYQSMERKLYDMLGDICAILELEPPARGQETNFVAYREALMENDDFDNENKLAELLKERKSLRKSLNTKFTHIHRQQMLEEHKRSLSRTGTVPGAVLDPDDTAITAFNTQGAAGNHDDDDDGDYADGADIDHDAIEETEAEARDMPEHWAQLKDDVFVRPEGNEDGKTTSEARLYFIKTFTTLATIPLSNLKCRLCLMDPTVADPHRVYNFARLEKHLKGSFHTRASEISRAINNSGGKNESLTCPLCNQHLRGNKFAEHVAQHHNEHV